MSQPCLAATPHELRRRCLNYFHVSVSPQAEVQPVTFACTYTLWLLKMTRLSHLLAAVGLALSGASACPECGMGNTPADKIEAQNEQSLFWGPYKPNLYFGVRPRIPEGLWTGLLWGGVNTFEEVPKSMAPAFIVTLKMLRRKQISGIHASKVAIFMDMAGMSTTHVLAAFSLSTMTATRLTLRLRGSRFLAVSVAAVGLRASRANYKTARPKQRKQTCSTTLLKRVTRQKPTRRSL